MKLQHKDLKLKHFAMSHAKDLVSLANNIKIARNLRDGFPHPYTIDNAKEFIKRCNESDKQFIFGIFYKEELAGSIGLFLQENVYRITAELGYWIGEPYWNKGIASKSIALITEFGFESLHLTRIFAGVFDYNKASMKVLEKNDYKLECVKRKAVIKDEIIMDEYYYAKVNE